MEAIYNGRTFKFRPCDTEGLTQAELQKKVDETGKIQYEPGRKWLVVRGVGYAWEVEK